MEQRKKKRKTIGGEEKGKKSRAGIKADLRSFKDRVYLKLFIHHRGARYREYSIKGHSY